MATYTQTAGDALGHKYFMDVEISPVTVADGSLVRRFDPISFPKLGVRNIASPTIGAVSPATVTQNTGADITITGTHFLHGATVSVSGAGLTVTDVRRMDDEDSIIVAHVAASAGATPGARNVTVTNVDGGTVTATGALTVAASAVTVISVLPTTKAENTTGDIVITGTGFESGAAATFSGAGITVNSTTFNSATQVTANITVAVGAAHTARNVTVTNSDTGAGTLNAALTITA